jgi:hypothetical protein
MPNEYSVEIHQYLSKKIAEAGKTIEESSIDKPNCQGLIDELLWIRKYLSDKIDLKDFTYY